jgi:type IV secretion system protein VirB3
MSVQSDILFQGATRPTMLYGVPADAMIVMGGTVMILFIGIGNPLYLLIYPPLHTFAVAICASDARAFRLLYMALVTKGVCLNRRHWRASSYSPAAVRDRRRGHAR